MAQVKWLDRAYMTEKDYTKIVKKYGEVALRKEEKKTKAYIDKIVAGPERDLIVETARVKRLWHEINNPEEIDDAEWHRMQLRMYKKGFDEGIKIYKILKATYNLTKHKEVARQIRKTAFDFTLMQDGIRPGDMSDEAAAQWEAKHGAFKYVWDGAHVRSMSGKSKFTLEDFRAFKDEKKIFKSMMEAAQPIMDIQEEEDEYDR